MKKTPRTGSLYPRVPKKYGEFKVVVWDIETSELASNLGVIITSAIKPLGKAPVTHVNAFLGVDGLRDKELVISIRDTLENADIIVSFYGLGFDLKTLNSRLMYWGEKPLSRKLHIDLYRLAKRYFNTSRRNLDTLCAHLGIRGKTHVDLEYWKKAKINGDKKAIKYILNHNIADVEITEKLFYRLKGLIQSISLA